MHGIKFQLSKLFNTDVQFVSYRGLRIAFHSHGKVSNSAMIVDYPELVVLELDFMSLLS